MAGKKMTQDGAQGKDFQRGASDSARKADGKGTARAMTPIRAIRAKCIDCSGDNVAEVRACALADCPLHPYRMGRNPNRKGREMTDAERAACVERLAKARAKAARKEEGGAA